MGPTSDRAVIVIGSSRSGTSLVARLLAANGIFMGADVESNHESRSLQAVNRWLLQQAGVSLDTAAAGRVAQLVADPLCGESAESSTTKSRTSCLERGCAASRRRMRSCEVRRNTEATSTCKSAYALDCDDEQQRRRICVH